MAIALTVVASIANTLYQPGIGSAASTEGIVTPGAILVHADIDVRNHTDPLTGIDIRVECSLDGGVTWDFVIGAHRDGGTITTRTASGFRIRRSRSGCPAIRRWTAACGCSSTSPAAPLVLNGTLSTG
jgi:hypothetical protein